MEGRKGDKLLSSVDTCSHLQAVVCVTWITHYGHDQHSASSILCNLLSKSAGRHSTAAQQHSRGNHPKQVVPAAAKSLTRPLDSWLVILIWGVLYSYPKVCTVASRNEYNTNKSILDVIVTFASPHQPSRRCRRRTRCSFETTASKITLACISWHHHLPNLAIVFFR